MYMYVGTALITVATGPMSEAQEERTGLVKTHAYAVLNIAEVKGIKLLQLKNPWSHRRWKVCRTISDLYSQGQGHSE